MFYVSQLYEETGFFQLDQIDSRDDYYWQYENGFIKGSGPISLTGNNSTCWMLIHSYTASPAEMSELANKINKRFNETVHVPRLSGHGELPSSLIGKNLYIWYDQVEKYFLEINKDCEKVNLIGSSFGAILASRLSENYNINNLYLVNPFITKTHKFYKIIPFKLRTVLFSDIFLYSKKDQIAYIKDPEGLKEHISYWNFPYSPVKESLPFIDLTISELYSISSPILIQHSINDETADKKGAQIIFDKVNSEHKKLIFFTNSSHVLLMDYDKEEVINNVLSFEELRRDEKTN